MSARLSSCNAVICFSSIPHHPEVLEVKGRVKQMSQAPDPAPGLNETTGKGAKRVHPAYQPPHAAAVAPHSCPLRTPNLRDDRPETAAGEGRESAARGSPGPAGKVSR